MCIYIYVYIRYKDKPIKQLRAQNEERKIFENCGGWQRGENRCRWLDLVARLIEDGVVRVDRRNFQNYRDDTPRNSSRRVDERRERREAKGWRGRERGGGGGGETLRREEQ